MTPEELDDLYLAALKTEEAGDTDAALAMFRRGAQAGDTSAYNAIGCAYNSGQGVAPDKRAAIEWFEKAWDDGKQPSYIANIASTYADIGESEEAEQWWLRAVGGGDKSAHLGYAEFLLKRERYGEMARILELVEVAANAEARMEVSEYEKEAAQELLGNLQKARTDAEIAEAWWQYEADQMFERGGESAKAYFANLTRSDSRKESAHFFLMLLAIDERDLHRALECAREVKELSPFDQNLNLNIGRIYELAGTYDKAIACYKRELALFPNSELAYFNLGTTCFKMRRLNKAIFYFEKAVDSPGSDWTTDALSYLARIYAGTGEIVKERQIYREMVSLDPNWASPLQNLGATYLDTRDYTRALEILQRAKIIDESDAMIDRNIARAERGLARYGRKLKRA